MFKSKKLILLEANLDDMNPEWYEPLMDLLFEAGALDVTLQPILMKKSRPAILLQVLAEPRLRNRLLPLLFEHSTTLGVRIQSVERVELKRRFQKIRTPFGEVVMKQGLDASGRVINLAPEFESCKKIAKAKKIPLKKIYAEALKASVLDPRR